MRIYTRTGDDGTTGLVNGDRVLKSSARIEACGAVDEANSAIGLALASCGHEPLAVILKEVQNHLFEVGAALATPLPSKVGGGDRPYAADDTDALGMLTSVQRVETQIDELGKPLPPLKHFVLPGGGELAARLHLARAICRRAERRCVGLAELESISPDILRYLNRLSDLLFTMGRHANQLECVDDVRWPEHRP